MTTRIPNSVTTICTYTISIMGVYVTIIIPDSVVKIEEQQLLAFCGVIYNNYNIELTLPSSDNNYG